MDFFRSQDVARRNTRRLVLLFSLALLSLIAITNLLILVGLGMFAETLNVPMFQRIDWPLFAWVSGAIVLVVACGSLFRILSLAGGGARVAELLQGRLLLPGSSEWHEQRILNVVEEMAIASGTPVPPVYVLDEPGINAFAAGYAPTDAVIGITRGAIETLSRDELQGVVAHEFSHILHGDMRLNIRLIGILYGILVLGIMGEYLLRSTRHSRRSRDSGNIAVVGLGLMLIGYAGTFFGNLIKAAVSRQREFLADASAVQYTRNPDGIAGALKRIGSSAAGSTLGNPATSEISHALFANGLQRSFSALFATHPPLGERIRRIDPAWDGRFEQAEAAVLDADAAQSAGAGGPGAGGASAVAGVPPAAGADSAGALAALALSTALLEKAGRPQESDLEQARHLLASLPPVLLEAAHHPFSASALVYLLLLDRRPEVVAQQQAVLDAQAEPAIVAALQTLQAHQAQLRPEVRLPLLSVALPALRQMSPEQYTRFRKTLLALVQADGKVSLWEWVLQRVVLQQLDGVFAPRSRFHHTAQRSLQQLRAEVVLLLAFLIRAGGSAGATAVGSAVGAGLPANGAPAGRLPQTLLDTALAQLGLPAATLPGPDAQSPVSINTALDALTALKPLQKPAFLKACAAVIVADGVTAVGELEIFRALAAALDCPLPPLPATAVPLA
jgi:Zn-dependent protease with chaperone function